MNIYKVDYHLVVATQDIATTKFGHASCFVQGVDVDEATANFYLTIGKIKKYLGNALIENIVFTQLSAVEILAELNAVY